MNSSFKRRMSSPDGIILVAATAISLACLMEVDTQTRYRPTHSWLRSLQEMVWVELLLRVEHGE